MFEMEEGRFSAPQINPLLPGYTSQSIDSIWYVTAPTDDDRIQLTVTGTVISLESGLSFCISYFSKADHFFDDRIFLRAHWSTEV